MSTASSCSASTSSCELRASSASGSKTNVGAIVGGVIGGLVAGVAAGVLALWSLQRHRKKKAPHGNELEDTAMAAPAEKYAMRAELPYQGTHVNELHSGPTPVELGGSYVR
jgi:hypothetical protein